MIEPEKPPLRIANSTSWTVSLRKSRSGPSVRSFCDTLVAEPCVAAADSVWQPPQRSWKSTAPWWAGLCGWLLSALIFWVPHAETASAAAVTPTATQRDLGRNTGAHISEVPEGPRRRVAKQQSPRRWPETALCSREDSRTVVHIGGDCGWRR